MTCCTVDAFCAVKDPEEVLDYNIDYTVLLQETEPDDAIATSTWSILHDDGSLLIDTDAHDGLIATVWLSAGGKLGSFWKVTNHITTTAGREYERTITVWIQSK
jgi:hypothetical protein